METAEAMSAFREKLESTFGKAMTMLIIASASSAAQVPTTALTPAEFGRLVDATCKDQRVLDMWGHAEAADISTRFKQHI